MFSDTQTNSLAFYSTSIHFQFVVRGHCNFVCVCVWSFDCHTTTMPIHINRSGFICLSSAFANRFPLRSHKCSDRMEFGWIMSNAFRLKESMGFESVNRSVDWCCACILRVPQNTAVNITILNLCYRKIEFRIH